jgi:hypothetical protein
VTLAEKPSFWRRVAQFFCSHWAWEGAEFRNDDGTPCVTVRRCMSCGLMTWERHRWQP